MAAGIESKANLYLLDEGLLDDCGGCQHVGHKAAALGEGEQLGCWDCFNWPWRNSSNERTEGFEGGCIVDLLDTFAFIKVVVMKPRWTKYRILLATCFEALNTSHDYQPCLVRPLPWSLRQLWLGWLWWTAPGSRCWLTQGWTKRKSALTGQLKRSGRCSGLRWHCPGSQTSLLWWSGCWMPEQQPPLQ